MQRRNRMREVRECAQFIYMAEDLFMKLKDGLRACYREAWRGCYDDLTEELDTFFACTSRAEEQFKIGMDAFTHAVEARRDRLMREAGSDDDHFSYFPSPASARDSDTAHSSASPRRSSGGNRQLSSCGVSQGST